MPIEFCNEYKHNGYGASVCRAYIYHNRSEEGHHRLKEMWISKREFREPIHAHGYSLALHELPSDRAKLAFIKTNFTKENK